MVCPQIQPPPPCVSHFSAASISASHNLAEHNIKSCRTPTTSRWYQSVARTKQQRTIKFSTKVYRPKTRNEHLYETAWREIDGHHSGSTRFNAVLDEAKVQHQVFLDISTTLRKQNKSYHNANNSLDTHCRNLTNSISVLDRDLKQAQGRGDEVERQKIEIQQQLHARNEELVGSVVTAEALRLEIEALQVRVKGV